MSPPVSLTGVTASADVRDAVRRIISGLDGRSSAAVAALNFTDCELVLERVEHELGTFATPPDVRLPAQTATTFSVHSADAATRTSGRLDWRGTDPDNGEFYFELVWCIPRSGAPIACARTCHRIPFAAGARSGWMADGMPVPTTFLRAAAVADSGRAIAQLSYELHPLSASAHAVGAFSRALQVDLGDPLLGMSAPGLDALAGGVRACGSSRSEGWAR